MTAQSSAMPDWVESARNSWTHRGQARPPFAERPGPGQESVWDYPRPPRTERDGRRVVVRLGGVIVASTRAAIRFLETAHAPSFYIPRQDVELPLLSPTGSGSFCEWKGSATYFDVAAGSESRVRAAWAYLRPFDQYKSLAGHVAFYPQLLDCCVDDEPVTPQPGGFYGGWITGDVVGPFKGDPGSRHW